MLLSKILLLKKVFRAVRQIGLYPTISLVVYKLLTSFRIPKAIKGTVSLIPQATLPASYQVITESLKYQSVQSTSNSQHQPSLGTQRYEFVWLVPFFSKGSGGHKSLFQFVKGLESLGCKCTVYVVGDYDITLEPAAIKNQIHEYFETISADVQIYNPKFIYEKANIVVCTSWITAYAGRTIDADLKVYFVQDYEPFFYSMGSYWYLAQHTYNFGYYHITLGRWLTHILQEKHGVRADNFEIVVDRKLYYPRQVIKNQSIKSISDNSSFKVCFYGRSVTPRRCFELIVMALYLFAEKARDITLISYGWNDVSPLLFPYHNLGILPVGDLAELYSVCDVCIAPSATNLSLVAHEVMACGCVLMDISGENTSYDLKHLSNSYLVNPDPKSMCDGLLHLYNDRQLLKNIKESSLKHAYQLHDWEYQVNTFYNLVKQKHLTSIDLKL